MTNCSVSFCERPVHCRSLCKAHYERKRTGHSLDHPVRVARSLVIDGKKVCGSCRSSLPVSHFSRLSRAPSGLNSRCRNCQRRAMRTINFGLSEEDYLSLLVQQGHVCAICGKAESARSRSGRPKPLSVDHNHNSGQVRGLLCSRCNTALGMILDDIKMLDRIRDYLGRVTP